MDRESNIAAWQMGLFDGFDRDIMVMQRDEQEVFDDALHVFFEKEYYDAYVAKAAKYGTHSYAYHEDKLGEVVNQIFDENIPGLVFHMQMQVHSMTGNSEGAPKDRLCDERYISADELLGFKELADSYHLMYTASIDRCPKEKAVAELWLRYVYIVGQIPDPRKKPANGAKQVFELMTVKRKKDGSPATAKDFDYESLQVFLTPQSAMRFNRDKKPVSKYKLSLLAQLVKGKLQIAIEPQRGFCLEFDPAKIDLSEYLDIPHYNEELAKARISEFAALKKAYILLNPMRSDYKASVGNPFFLKQDEKNVMMFMFEDYGAAVDYVLQNPNVLPVFDSTFPIGELSADDSLCNIEVVVTLADKLGVTMISLDADTKSSIAGSIGYFEKTAGYSGSVEELFATERFSAEDLEKVVREENGEKKYRLPVIPFCDKHNDYAISDERREELIKYADRDVSAGLSYAADLSVPELIVVMNEIAKRFDKARNDNDEDAKLKYSRLMSRLTVPLTEGLCLKPYIFTLKEKDGEFTLKNNLAYLIVTDRFEAGRKGEGQLMPVGVDNEQFMEKLCAKANVAVLTDGPNTVCLMDTHLMFEVAKQWKKSEALREELLIYMTQGCGLAYDDAVRSYRRLKSDKDIFVEFTSSVRNGEFPPMGMIEVNGSTAKTIAEKDGCTMLQAYEELLSIKEGKN